MHGLPSLQASALLPPQTPLAQMSPVVHALSSLHGSLLSLVTQPVLALQLSSVHKLPSLHALALPGMQAPPSQASFSVQTLPSLQVPVLATKVQPCWASQLSVVHGLPSLQVGPLPGTQAPDLHMSPMVQALLSSHAIDWGVFLQPSVALQVSRVHKLPSSQPAAKPEMHSPFWHASPAVHKLPSVQGAVLLLKTQPILLSQLSSVQGLPSLQATALPGWQAPAAQMSPTVQMLLSSQAAVLLVDVQPPWASQFSVVQGLPSSHGLGFCGLHTPPLQASPLVQLLLSSQVAVLSLNWQPFCVSQLSSVHGLPSLQGSLPGAMQVPPLHTSPRLQTLPSLQGSWLLANTQPALGSQLSVVQGFWSSHGVAAPGRQALSLQVSPMVHALPSLQLAPSSEVATQPFNLSQLSMVQGFLSSQAMAAPAHFSPWHVSPLVQASLSSQSPPLVGCWQSPPMQLS